MESIHIMIFPTADLFFFMNRLVNRTVFITGASAGIGEATAKAFASYGAHLVKLQIDN
jgi:FlaA1/EpsC-like NDP-sugar epimerase